MDTWIWNQVSLELGHIDVESTIEAERGGERGDNLSDEAVKVGVGWALDVEGAAADVVDGLVVKHEGNIGVLEEGVSGEDGVVWLNNSGGDLWGWVDAEIKLGLLSVVNGETLEKEGTETGTSSSTDGVEDTESLETSAVVGKLADAVEAKVDDFLSDGVVATGVVVSSVLLASNKLLRVEKLTVGSSADLIDNGWLEIDEDSARDVLSGTSLREEGVESIITTTDGLVRWHLAVRLDTVLKAVKFPAGITDLDTSLTNVD